MTKFFFPQILVRPFLKRKLFSKKRARDIIFFFHFFMISLPIFAMHPKDPTVDPSLRELRSHFIRATAAKAIQGEHSCSLEVRGDYLGLYGLPQDKAALYASKTPPQISTLIFRSPEPGYLDRQGLYHGYRLLFGNGYIVPSMLVQFKDIQSNESWIFEVLPEVQSLSNLKDLKGHYTNYSLGVHFFEALFFPHQSFMLDSFNFLREEETLLIQRKLSSQDRLESLQSEATSSNAVLLEIKKVSLPDKLKNRLKQHKVNQFMTHWLSILSDAEERARVVGYTEAFQIKEQTLHNLAIRLQKMIGIVSQPYDLSYGDVETLTKVSSLSSLQPQPLRGIKEVSLLTLHKLFFRNEQQDWTEVFETLGETFETYGKHFTKSVQRLKGRPLLNGALQKNRKVSTFTFMLNAGLCPTDFGDSLIDVVHYAGQRLDIMRALDWIKALGKAGVPLEHKDHNGNTPLDLAFQQRKHKVIEALIEIGAGHDVKPHVVIDYLNILENKQTFNASLDLLEFRNPGLRWQLTLQSLFPLHTGQKGGLVIKTMDGERMLDRSSVKNLWKGGKVSPENFISFTETAEPTQKKYGRRIVGKITNGRYTLYVKRYPELPGIEEAVGTLTRKLLGYGAPHTLLANVGGTAYLFSEGVSGRPLQDYLTGKTDVPWEEVSQNLDSESISGMMLLAMLTNPEDGKPDNYVVERCPDGKYRIVGVDNDHAFIPSVTIVQDKKTINVKSILFALDQMNQEVNPHLKQKFIYYNPKEIVEEWVETLIRRSKQYEALFSQNEVTSHFKGHESFLGIALHPNIVVGLYKNMSSLQQLVESEGHLTHMDLLRRFHKSIYLRYQEGHDQRPTANPLERFTYVDGKDYKISKHKELETLSTGANLLSTNMMITTQKDLFDYVNKKRGREIGLETALQKMRDMAEQDTHKLVQQAINQVGSKIPLEEMTDPERQSFLEALDWSKLSVAHQQALLDQIAKVSWGDPAQHREPWRGKITFKNCRGFTEGTFFSKAFDQKMNWKNIHEVRLIVDSAGGKEAYLNGIKLLEKTQIPIKVELRDLTLTDEELDLIASQRHVKKLILINCQGIEDPLLREKHPNLVWKDWMKLNARQKGQMRKVIMEDFLGLEDRFLHDNIGDEGAKVLAVMLKDTEVQTLDLSNNNIGAEGAKALAIGIKNTQVQELDLSENNIEVEGAKALASVLKDTKVRTLNLDRNNIEDEGVKALADVLKDTQVQELDLSHNYIGDEVVKALVAVLKDTKVQELGLSHNYIGDEGVKALVSVLKDTKLQTLDLSNNNIGAEGAKELASMLKDTKVQTLNLSWNKIGDEGAKALASMLKDTKVQTLNLSWNKIGDEGAKALAIGLKGTQVQTLKLSFNKIGYLEIEKIEEILRENKAKYASLPEMQKKKEAQQKESSRDFGAKPKAPTLHEEDSLEVLLAEAWVTGGLGQQIFATEVDRAQYLLEQKDSSAYFSILKILEHVIASEKKNTDMPSSSFDNQKVIFLLSELSRVYPPALLSLSKIHHDLGNTNEVVESLREALKHQLPGTLEQIKALLDQKDTYVNYALLMAENNLQGYLSSPDFDQGEAWIRKALDKDPTNPDILTQLAQVLLEKEGLEDRKTYEEIQSLLSKAKEQNHIGAFSLDLMIKKMEKNREIRDIPLSPSDEGHTIRHQLLLHTLYQSQFEASQFEMRGLEKEQENKLKGIYETYEKKRAETLSEIEKMEEYLKQALPLDITNIERGILKLKQDLDKIENTQRQEIQNVLFPEKVTTFPVFKKFYEELSEDIKDQLLLLDKTEKGLSPRKEAFSEERLKEGADYAVAALGKLIVSNVPIPGAQILGTVFEKIIGWGLDKLKDAIHKKVSSPYKNKEDQERKNVKESTQNYDPLVVANSLSALYTYRLQNILPYLTEKSYKDLAVRLSASVLSYLQDEKRIMNSPNLTQLMVMGFYDTKKVTFGRLLFATSGEIGAIAGKTFDKVRGKHGVKKITGDFIPYERLFESPLIETTDGARYQMQTENAQHKKGEGEDLLQIAPLVEKEILGLLGTKNNKLYEKRSPQMPPIQVKIIQENDDMDYARRAFVFMESFTYREEGEAKKD